MDLFLDEPSEVTQQKCDQCGSTFTHVKNFILDQDGPYAVAMTACHLHDGVREAWMDVALGRFATSDYLDHVSFGCRVGPIDGREDPGASAVDAATPYDNGRVWGKKLSRGEALAHPRVAEFWQVVDFVLMHDSVIHSHVYGAPEPAPPKLAWRWKS